jgi:hypothetical protein
MANQAGPETINRLRAAADSAFASVGRNATRRVHTADERSHDG